MERRAVELDAGARKLNRGPAIAIAKIVIPVILKPNEVYRSETDDGYSSIRVPHHDGEMMIMLFVDRDSDGLYRLKRTVGDPPWLTETTNFVDWHELKELYEFLEARCARGGG